MNQTRKLSITMLAIAAALLVACSRSGPEKTLFDIKEAIEDKDAARFERYVDLDAVLSQAVNLYMVDAMSDLDGGEGFEALGAAMGMAMMEKMKPMLIDAAKASILAEIEGRNTADDGKAENIKDLYDGTKTDWDVEFVNEQGPIAYVGLAVSNDDGEDMVAELRMERTADGDWRVNQIRNLQEIIDKQKAKEKELLAIRQGKLDELNLAVRERMARYFVIDSTDLVVRGGNYEQSIVVIIDGANRSDVAVKDATVTVSWQTAAGEPVPGLRLSWDDLPANSTERARFEVDVNPFFDERGELYEDIKNDRFISIEYELIELELEDGTSIELFQEIPDNN